MREKFLFTVSILVISSFGLISCDDYTNWNSQMKSAMHALSDIENNKDNNDPKEEFSDVDTDADVEVDVDVDIVDVDTDTDLDPDDAYEVQTCRRLAVWSLRQKSTFRRKNFISFVKPYSGDESAIDTYNCNDYSSCEIPETEPNESSIYFYKGPEGLSFNFSHKIKNPELAGGKVSWKIQTLSKARNDHVLYSDDSGELSKAPMLARLLLPFRHAKPINLDHVKRVKLSIDGKLLAKRRKLMARRIFLFNHYKAYFTLDGFRDHLITFADDTDLYDFKDGGIIGPLDKPSIIIVRVVFPGKMKNIVVYSANGDRIEIPRLPLKFEHAELAVGQIEGVTPIEEDNRRINLNTPLKRLRRFADFAFGYVNTKKCLEVIE